VPANAVVITRRAVRQVEVASAWWTANRPAAPHALRDDLAAALTLIADQPTCGVPTASRSPGLRRIHLARVGYNVYYRVAPRLRQVQIVALWHARRGSPPSL
jgi:plasmid stabilization system protein ParE